MMEYFKVFFDGIIVISIACNNMIVLLYISTPLVNWVFCWGFENVGMITEAFQF